MSDNLYNDKDIAQAILVTTIVLCGIFGFVIYSIVDFSIKQEEKAAIKYLHIAQEQAIQQCEESLPRNQHCEIVIGTRVVDDE